MSDFANLRVVGSVDSEAGGDAGLSYAPDGRRFVAACPSGAKVFDSSSAGRPLCTLNPRAGRICRAVWSPCGRTIALGTLPGDIVLYDALMGAELRRWKAGRTVRVMAFSPCGTRLLSGAANHPVVRVWDVATAKLICDITDANKIRVMSASFLPGDSGDAASVISVSSAGRVSINSASDGSVLRRLELGVGGVITMALSPSGSHIALRLFDRKVRVCSVADGSEVSLPLQLCKDVAAVAWASDSVVIVGGDDASLVFFDVASNAELNRVQLPAEDSLISPVAVRPGGCQVIASCDDRSIHLLAGE